MAGIDNLQPVRSEDEAREKGAKGGKASGEARRKKKQLKEAFEMLLEADIEAKNGEIVSGADAIALQVFKRALKGDLRAFEIIRDTAGQKPRDQVYVEHEEHTNSELMELIEALKGGGKDEAGE